MRQEEYALRITQMSDKAYQDRWQTLSSDLRKQGTDCRTIDAEMTLIMQGLAVQVDRLLEHIKKRKTSIDKALQIKKNAEPIENEIPIEETKPNE